MERFSRITHNPAVMGGKACIRGMRFPVSTILSLLASGIGREEILEHYPYLEVEDFDAAIDYAAWRMREYEQPLAVTSASEGG